jgi:hypothetical protein
MSVKNRNSIVTDGLVFYVDAGNEDSYPGSGTTLTDLKGGVSGSLANSPSFTSNNGGGIACDGTDDEIQLGTIGDTIPASFTWSFWANTGTFSGGTSNDTAWLATTRSDSGNGIWMYLKSSTAHFTVGAISGYSQSVSLSNNTVYNVCFVVDSGTLKIYVDGSLNGSTFITTTRTQTNDVYYSGVFLNSDGSVRAGSHSDTTYHTFLYHDKALSADEITQNYNALKNRFI